MMKFFPAKSLAIASWVILVLMMPGSGFGDLVAHWTGDNTAVDATSNGHDGTINGATFGTGIIGNAFSFDGINDSVIVFADPALEPTTISVALWVQSISENHLRNLIDSTHGAGQSGWALQLNAANNVSFAYGNGSTFPESSAPITLDDGLFHHVAATLDGSNMRLYVDGSLQVTTPYSGTPSPSGRDIQIGHHLSQNRPLDGLLDDIRIYNEVLDSSQVTALFNMGSVPEPASAGWLAAAGIMIAMRRRKRIV